MMRSEVVLACLGMAVVTYLCRSVLTVSVSRVRLNRWWGRFLTCIPLAVLTALVTPYLLFADPGGKLALPNPYMVGGAVTLAVSFRTRSLLWSVGIGMAVFWVLGGMR